MRIICAIVFGVLAALPNVGLAADAFQLARDEGRIRASVDVCATTAEKPGLLRLSARFVRSLSLSSSTPLEGLETEAQTARANALAAGKSDASKCATAFPTVRDQIKGREAVVAARLAR